MDKNKKKSDLLAAGRKKLQQFRQKKENKASKSSKSGKTDRDADTSSPKQVTTSQSGKMDRSDGTSSPKRAATSQSSNMDGSEASSSPKQATTPQAGQNGKQSSHDANDPVTSSESHPQGAFLDSTLVDQPPEAATPGATAEKISEFSMDATVVNQPPDPASARETEEMTSGFSMGATVVDQPSDAASAGATAEKTSEFSVDATVVDQPPDAASAGATEEKTSEFSVGATVVDQPPDAASAGATVEKTSEFSVDATVVDQPPDAASAGATEVKTSEFSVGATVVDQPPDAASAGATAEKTSEFSVDATVVDRLPDAASVGATAKQTSDFSMQNSAQDHQNAEGSGLMQVDETAETVNGEDGKPSTSESDAPLIVAFETMNDQSEASMRKQSINYPEVNEEIQAETVGEDVDTQGSSVSTSHFHEEVLRSEINKFPARQDFVEMEPLLERLKEQLYLTTLVKDAAHLELSEQINIQSELSQQGRQFSEKLSSARTSLDEIYSKNENLAEEVARYESQLKEAVSVKEGLQEELNESKEEVGKSSARVNQLMNELEISRCDLSRLTSELVECRNSIVAFQAESETLRQSLHIETEEKEQLAVQKTSMILENKKLESELTKYKDLLVTMQSENMNMTEHVARAGGTNDRISSENELLLSQNDKLVTELGECKNMLLNLQLENENLNSLVLEEKKKIDHEKDYLLNESEEIAIESIKCMVLVEAMKMEIFTNKSILVPPTDERSILEEEKMYLFAENEKLSSESVNFKATIENLQAEIANSESLKEHSDCIEEANLELMIVLEALRQHVVESNVKGSELVSLYEASEDLKGQLEASKREHELVSSTYKEINNKFNGLQEQHKMAFTMLHKIYYDLVRLIERSSSSIEENGSNTMEEILLDPRAPGGFDSLVNQLEACLSERQMLESENNRLSSELIDRTNDIDEINKNNVGSDAVHKLLEKFGQDFRIERFGSETAQPLAQLEFLIYSLQNYKEASERENLSRDTHAYNYGELSDSYGQIDHLSLSLILHENEVFVLKESLKNLKDSFLATQAELLGKIAELKQSEQRVSSLREKLSIAVTKGKGLIVQRDNLKQSLADTSTDFEKCKQDLLAKESRLSELENKLKAYMEAGERMEALESELSYIRNSATALRESFLQKDSALQRIEEILEDLELPENFHSGDIIEKIDWLANYVSGNSLPPADYGQKTSVSGGASSDAELVDAGGWKEEMGTNTSDNHRKKYEDLETRFYSLAEQNEILEQSLMERNNLVQRWEEIVDKIQVPSELRSMKPEDRIEWLGGTLSEAENYCNSLQEKIDNLETSYASLTTDLERSEQRIFELEKELQPLITEKESLSKNLEILTQDYDEMSKKASGLEVNNGSLEREVVSLQERLDQKQGCEERTQYFEGEISRLQDVLMGVLQDSDLKDTEHRSDNFNYFENLIMKLIEKHAELSRAVLDKPDAKPLTEDIKEPVEQFKVPEDLKTEIINLNKKLEDSISELLSVKEERNGYLEKKDSLVLEVEALETKMTNLQGQLSQEEQKSSTLREKLNVAVRKGKSLVQQRDSMKQAVEVTNAENGQLKSVVSEYENKTKDLSTLQEKVETLTSENVHLRDLISQSDQAVQGNDHTSSKILEALGHIDMGLETDIVDPVEKLEKMAKRSKDLLSDLATMEQELSKSKRAAELLVDELNEVQERNDVLQEELEKVSADLSALSRERDHYHAEAMQMKPTLDQLDKDISSLSELLGNVLSNDLETLHGLKVSIKSCHELGDDPSLLAQLHGSIPGDLASFKSEDKALMQGIVSLRGQLYRHLELVHEECSGLVDLIGRIYSQLKSQKESCESMTRDIQRLESVETEKDSKLLSARRNFSLLLHACTTTVSEIDNFKAELVGHGYGSGDSKVNANSNPSKSTEEVQLFSSEEDIRAIQEQLSFAVKDLMSMQEENSESNIKDMRSTILGLQKELQEKDIQGERNCMQLVQQIKEAEAIAKKYSQELQLSQGNVEELQREVRVMGEELNVLEKRTKDLQDKEAASMEDNGRIQSVTQELAAKSQENEALLQALDEEENQMEDMRNKVGELERALQKKEKDLEKLNISRGKALKKHSVTVSKFDELHQLSENLLSEVENLQSQLQDRDQEISFLRQEVTRCTKDALLASQNNNKRNSDEVSELLEWLATMISRVQAVESDIGDMKTDEYKEMLKEHIISAVSELEDLRVAVQNGDMLLQSEKAKVEELTSREHSLQSNLREKESQLAMLHGDVGQETTTKPGMIKKKAVPAAVAPQVRSLRKSHSEQVAIAIDVGPDKEKLEEDDDDKAHGFRSLTTSRIVPRFTRPITNLVDGWWVSCDRTLMRQPILRLGVMIYWALVHALLTAYVV